MNWYDDFDQIEQTEEYQVFNKLFGIVNELSRFMKEKGINKTELAKRMETSPSYITQIFRLNKNISIKTLIKLCQALEIDFKFIFYENDNKVLPITDDKIIPIPDYENQQKVIGA